MFGEKKNEWSNKQGKEIPVWQSPKYNESREKAIEIIKDGRYGLSEADFWIQMNETKSGKMAYTGLIISHNGCLKINNSMTEKFRPECVTMDKEGYNGSLVYSYCCPDQGLYEVGEVNPKNCKIEYPYAMALKRLQDRVILKLCKLAYSGIYSEAEADEFERRDEPEEQKTETVTTEAPIQKPKERQQFICADCGKPISDYRNSKGNVSLTAKDIAARSLDAYGRMLCMECSKAARMAMARAQGELEEVNENNGGRVEGREANADNE